MSPPPGAAWPAQIRQIGDPVLRTAVAPVADFGTALERLVDRMWAAMTDAHGVGLAANQIGVGLAVFVYQVDAFAGVLVNPGEPDLSGPLVLRDEDCLSVVGHSYPTERFEHAVVQGQDLTGRQVTVTGHGLTRPRPATRSRPPARSAVPRPPDSAGTTVSRSQALGRAVHRRSAWPRTWQQNPELVPAQPSHGVVRADYRDRSRSGPCRLSATHPAASAGPSSPSPGGTVDTRRTRPSGSTAASCLHLLPTSSIMVTSE